MASATALSKAVVLRLFVVALIIVCGGLVLAPCFVLQYFVSFLALQLSHWGRESWLLYFWSVLNVMSLLSFFDSSLRCHVLI